MEGREEGRKGGETRGKEGGNTPVMTLERAVSVEGEEMTTLPEHPLNTQNSRVLFFI